MDTHMNSQSKSVRSFYDGYWPSNVPDYVKTRDYVFTILPNGNYNRILDAGCGTGVCTLALAERANEVLAVDMSLESLKTAVELAHKMGKHNIEFQQVSVLDLPFISESFDLVYSWGVIHHTPNPIKALKELVRVLALDGILVLAVYQKTRLMVVHEIARKFCLKLPPFLKKPVVKFATIPIGMVAQLRGLKVLRDDNLSLESKIEDWLFVPEKHFFSFQEMRELFEQHHLVFKLIQEKTGRFKSTSNFVVWGLKAREAECARAY